MSSKAVRMDTPAWLDIWFGYSLGIYIYVYFPDRVKMYVVISVLSYRIVHAVSLNYRDSCIATVFLYSDMCQ